MAGYEKGGEDGIKAVSFAAGTAAFMACVERAVVVSVFVHWRVWAFLALNLLLLAILFTSKSQTPLNNQINGEDFSNAEHKKKKKRRREGSKLVSAKGGGGSGTGGEMTEFPPPVKGVEYETTNGEDDGKRQDYDQLSEEELKQRVEAFITMFRQQYLVC